jgi:hypothetical protein
MNDTVGVGDIVGFTNGAKSLGGKWCSQNDVTGVIVHMINTQCEIDTPLPYHIYESAKYLIKKASISEAPKNTDL